MSDNAKAAGLAMLGLMCLTIILTTAPQPFPRLVGFPILASFYLGRVK